MPSRLACVLLLTAMLFSAPGCGSAPATDPLSISQGNSATIAAPRDESEEQNAATEQKFGKLVDVAFDETKLVVAVEWLRRESGVSILPNWAALEAAGIEQDLPITLKLKQVSLRRVLQLTLEYAGGGGSLESIGFDIDRGVVRITTKRDLLKTVAVRHHDIRDLLDWPALQYTAVDPADPKQTKIGLETTSRWQMSWEEATEMIVEAVSNLVIEPDYGWSGYDFNGSFSSMREVDGVLIIKATPADHRDVASLLRSLRSQHTRLIKGNTQERAIAPLLDAANALRLKGDREAALRKTQAALLVRPDHPVAFAMQQVIADPLHRAGKGALVAAITRPTREAAAKVKPDPWQIKFENEEAPADPGRKATTAKLAKKVDVRFSATRLDKALEDLAARLDTTIYPSWPHLEAAGIEPDVPITLELSGVTGEHAMEAIMQQAAGGGALEPLAFEPVEGLVLFSTRRLLQKTSVARGYDIRDLMLWPALGHPNIDALLDDDPKSRRNGRRQTRVSPDALDAGEQIITLIQDLVGGPSDWRAYGGEVASARTGPHLIVVQAPVEFHEEITPLIEHMRGRMRQRLVEALAEQEIAPLVSQSADLASQAKYDAAMTVIEKALLIRPDHAGALATREAIRDMVERNKIAEKTR